VLTSTPARCAPHAAPCQAIEKSGVLAKWADTAWAKKLASRAKRATLSDFERFQVKVNKQKVCPPHTTAIPRLVWNLCLDLDSPP